MSEEITQGDLQNISGYIANSSIDWNRFTTDRGYANRKSAQKAMRRALKKLPLPTATASRPATKAKSPGRVKTPKQGLGQEGAGEGGVEATREGVGQRVSQGSDRFVQGRPFNEKIHRDFRPDRREFLGDFETSEEEEEEEDDDDVDDEESEDEESEEDQVEG
ncbi:hypothetical protein NU219Hw_g5282t1 [Hortaea werneckii]